MALIPYDAVLTVRLLLLRELRPGDWATFCLLQSSLAEWREMAPWEHNQDERIAIIRDKLGMDSFSRDEILEVGTRQQLLELSMNLHEIPHLLCVFK